MEAAPVNYLIEPSQEPSSISPVTKEHTDAEN